MIDNRDDDLNQKEQEFFTSMFVEFNFSSITCFSIDNAVVQASSKVIDCEKTSKFKIQ